MMNKQTLERIQHIRHPLVRQFFAISALTRVPRKVTAHKAGVSIQTISFWAQNRSRPTLPMFEAALAAHGYKLKIVPLSED
jgi:hypothetical protein